MEMKVFKVNDCEWVCAENKEKTIEFMISHVDREDFYSDDEIKECDIEEEGMWYGFTKDDFDFFIDNHKNELFKILKITYEEINKTNFIHRYRIYGYNKVSIYIPFKYVIEIKKLTKTCYIATN